MTNPDPFQNGNDANALPFPSPRQGWDEDPIATYYLRALNREIRALKSDYDLACSCHTYVKMAVLSLRLYLQEWEGLMGEIMGSYDSETEGELVSSEGVGFERLKELDEYREVLELMDTPDQDIPPDKQHSVPSTFWTVRTYRSYCLLHLSLAETVLHLMSPVSRVARVVVEWLLVGVLTILTTTFEPSKADSFSHRMAWTALMAVLGVAWWCAVFSAAWLVSLQRCKYEVRRIRQRLELNAVMKEDVEVFAWWWFKSLWWMSWLTTWIDELFSGGGRGRDE